MSEQKIFVGRRDELEKFGKVLEDPKGQAVLVVGQAGMGKTWLINKMAEVAENHPKLKCGWVRYEVTPTDSVDSTMALMMDNAFEAAQVKEKSFDGTRRTLEQWRSVLNVIKIGDLVMSLRRDPAKNTREQFLERLRLISKRMPENGRAVFIIDPEKYMQEKSDQSWAIVVKQLPEKIKFVFAQRPEDELLKSNVFKGLANVAYIPEGKLDVLEEDNVEDLVRLRAENVGKSAKVLRETMKRYKGHPYAIQAALDIVERKKSVEGLPQDPTPQGIAEAQWEGICECSDDAIKLFEAYAILEVGVTDEVVEAVSTLKVTTRKRLQRDSYLRGLLREEGEGRRIYHAILADYILGQIGEDDKKEYHNRAVGVYREKLEEAAKEQTKPDALAAMRLPEHVLAAEGEKAFVDTFVNECFGLLLRLGLLDASMGLSKRALKFVKKGSKDEASVMGDLGIIYRTRGELNNAEKIFTRILKIHKKIGPEKEMASDCANLGGIYVQLGVLDKAEEMFKSALEIDQKLGNVYEMGDDYGRIGVLYIKRKDFHKAEVALKKAITIHEKIERFDGVATNCGNLGRLYMREGKLDEGEKIIRKALGIHEKLGWLEGLAHDNMNLGVIYKQRGDVEKAREHWEKALELYKKIGMPHMVEKVEGWIGGLSEK